jgi:hypothetical protein
MIVKYESAAAEAQKEIASAKQAWETHERTRRQAEEEARRASQEEKEATSKAKGKNKAVCSEGKSPSLAIHPAPPTLSPPRQPPHSPQTNLPTPDPSTFGTCRHSPGTQSHFPHAVAPPQSTSCHNATGTSCLTLLSAHSCPHLTFPHAVAPLQGTSCLTPLSAHSCLLRP